MEPKCVAWLKSSRQGMIYGENKTCGEGPNSESHKLHMSETISGDLCVYHRSGKHNKPMLVCHAYQPNNVKTTRNMW
jgi:hypothetical protein